MIERGKMIELLSEAPFGREMLRGCDILDIDVIYNQDCMEGMKNIPDKSIDMIVTDPPYGISYQSSNRVKTKQFNVLRNDDNDMRLAAYGKFYRVLKQDAVAIVFASWKNMAKDYTELTKYFSVKNCIVWWKRGGGLGDLRHTLSTDYEVAFVCHKGKCAIRGKREGSVWDVRKVNPNKMIHPTQKPVELMERLILKFSDAGATVLDPFAGSGSTLIAARNVNRHYIGFELDEQYYKIARDRLQNN